MTLLDLAQRHVPLHRVSREWHGPCPLCGTSQSDPALSDRFWVAPEKERWYCRQCNPKGGDALDFLVRVEGLSCPQAHGELGRECTSTTCGALDKCSKGRGRRPEPRPLDAPRHDQGREFAPATATPPAELWRQKAEKLIEHAHAALLDCPEQLAYLAARGIPREAVEAYRLGWLDQDVYRPRQAWGLPEEISPRTQRPKRLWLPAGIVIPFYGDGHPFRIRIRRPAIKEGEPRYYWVPGSGDDVPVIGAGERAFVVVESDLDGFLVAWHARGLAGAVPLGTCSAKPKEAAMAVLRRALAILVSLDHEPRDNQQTGRHENPGGKAALWWEREFPRASRWPVPAGKDPGDYFKDHGGDIRAWVLAGLPPVFQVPVPESQDQGSEAEAPDPVAEQVPESQPPSIIRGTSQGGIPYLIAPDAATGRALDADHLEAAIFTAAEIHRLTAAGYTPADTADIIRARLLLRFGSELQVRSLAPAPADQPAAPPAAPAENLQLFDYAQGGPRS